MSKLVAWCSSVENAGKSRTPTVSVKNSVMPGMFKNPTTTAPAPRMMSGTVMIDGDSWGSPWPLYSP